MQLHFTILQVVYAMILFIVAEYFRSELNYLSSVLDENQMKYVYVSNNFNILECRLFEEPSAQQGWVAG